MRTALFMPARYDSKVKPHANVLAVVLNSLHRFHPMSNGLVEAFTEKCFEVNLARGKYLLQQGEISNYIYFLVSGIIAGYRPRGTEMLTTFISVSGDFVSAIDGMYGDRPVEDIMITESDCCLVTLRVEHLMQFFDDFPEMNIIMRKVLEEYYRVAHQRSVIMRMGNAKEKYEYYLHHLTTQTELIPVSLIASFLDIKTATLQSIIKDRSKAGQKSSDVENLFNLKKLVTEGRLFLVKRLRLGVIAQEMGITVHELSSLLNNHYGTNFTDFINAYRVNYVKEILRHGNQLQQLTIEALGNQAGFSSKSTFFHAFKKYTGMTPLAYAKHLDKAV